MDNPRTKQFLLCLKDGLEDLDLKPYQDKTPEALLQIVQSGPGNSDFQSLFSVLADAVQSTQENVTWQGMPDSERQQFGAKMNNVIRHQGFLPLFPSTKGPNETLWNKIHLFQLLVSELQAARMMKTKAQQKRQSEFGSKVAELCSLLRIPSNTTVPTAVGVSNSIQTRLREILADLGPEDFSQSKLLLDRTNYSEAQLEKLQSINQMLANEYALRRKMVLTRLDVTLKSMDYAEVAKEKIDEVQSKCVNKRAKLEKGANISTEDAFLATNDVLTIHRIDEADTAKSESIKWKIFVGEVPDRGGRPGEVKHKGKMPQFSKRMANVSRGGGQQRGGGGRGSGRGQARGRGQGGNRGGGRVQGGWGGQQRGRGRGGGWRGR